MILNILIGIVIGLLITILIIIKRIRKDTKRIRVNTNVTRWDAEAIRTTVNNIAKEHGIFK